MIESNSTQQRDPNQIKNLFGEIAPNYDRTNDFMTAGLVRQWRRRLVNWSQAEIGDSILDAATGTGDLAIEFAKTLGPANHVVGIDFCPEMLDLAPGKAREARVTVDFRLADIMSLPFPDQTFSVVSVAYGLRNVADLKKGLQEIYRVLKPGGRLMVLETGRVQTSLISPFLKMHFKWIVPLVGAVSGGSRTAYDYLNKSSMEFPSREQFGEIVKEAAPFSSVEFKVLWSGASYLYKATR